MALCTDVQAALDTINATIGSHSGRLSALEALELDGLATAVAAMATDISEVQAQLLAIAEILNPPTP